MIRRFVALSSTTSTVRPAIATGSGAAAGAGRAASSAWIARRNVLPSPGTPLLSAVSVPSISSASRRLIARPRPVPP